MRRVTTPRCAAQNLVRRAGSAAFECPLQIADLGPHVLHVGIDRQGQPKTLQGGDGVEHFQVAVAHAHGRWKMERIAFHRLLAVAQRVAEPLHLKVSNGSLIPGFRETVRLLNQAGRIASCLIETVGVVPTNDALQLMPLLFGTVAVPQFANAVLRQQTHHSITVVQRGPITALLSKPPRNPIDNTAARRVVREPTTASRASVPKV